MKTILFISEAASLAQVVRLATLARSLEGARYQVHFACARFDDIIFAGCPFTLHPIYSLSPATVDRRVRTGLRSYGRRTLARYVAEDRALMQRLRPDLVVGDLRLSLPVSAPASGVRYACLINAYWSPEAERDGFPLPDHPIVSLLGVDLAARHFRKALPYVFDHFARPVNALRRAHGLPPVGSLQNVLTKADYTLYPDVPALVPLRRPAASSGRFLGHVDWSAPVPLPPWWRRLDPGRPTVYLTLGSSGRVELLPLVIDTVAAMGFQVIVSTAGRAAVDSGWRHVYAADYLPGRTAARVACAVISNGGSSTGYQALAEGRPVLGIPSNLDQYLASDAIGRFGAGLHVRAGSAERAAIRAALLRLVGERSFAERAATAARELAKGDAGALFASFVDEALESRAPAHRARIGANRSWDGASTP